MPELPEVEVVRAGLERWVTGAVVIGVDVLHERPVRRDPRGPAGFAAALTGRRLGPARRRGKYLWVPLEPHEGEDGPGDALMAHLGMSGQMLVEAPDAPDERHLRVRMRLEGAADGRELRFVDQRMFGGLAISDGGAVVPPEISHVARDPLEADFDDGDWVRRVRRRHAGIKRLLLDQGLISGVGNIYADESLWRARLHGERPGDRLTQTRCRELLGHVRDVMTEALAQGGTSFDALYVDVNGASGYFDRSLAAYGQEGRPCQRCGTAIRRVAFTNRSSFFCPACQPAPRRRRVAPGAR